jgi:PleD family two-component response regulator
MLFIDWKMAESLIVIVLLTLTITAADDGRVLKSNAMTRVNKEGLETHQVERQRSGILNSANIAAILKRHNALRRLEGASDMHILVTKTVFYLMFV